jgi:dihydrolipoamide dehydrogenase
MSEKTIRTQIAVLGGGPAGYVAAVRAAQLGANVVLIENKALGGVCLNQGCIPTKALMHSAKDFSGDWADDVKKKDKIVKQLNAGVSHLLDSNGVTTVFGYGTALNANTIKVMGADGCETTIECEKMIIATGARPALPNIKGIELDEVLTSNELLDLDALPASIAVIGAGPMGLEFADMLHNAGVKVTVIEIADSILPGEDAEIAAEIYKILRRKGIGFRLSAYIKEIRRTNGGLSISFTSKGEDQIITCERVLAATGRALNTEAISSLELSKRNGAIIVNDHMETSVPGVYAAGDITGGRLLAHLSFMEGKVAAENAMGHNSKVNYNAVPACVYTEPEIATVGLTESEAKNRGIQPKTGRFYLRANGRAATISNRDGFVKVVADQNNTIIGAQILGVNASELISEMTLAITLSVKADVIADMIHPHPTISEAVWEACADVCKKAIHK